MATYPWREFPSRSLPAACHDGVTFEMPFLPYFLTPGPARTEGAPLAISRLSEAKSPAHARQAHNALSAKGCEGSGFEGSSLL
jgi:hypothetical protein